MSDLIIIGGGGHAKVLADLAMSTGHNVIGFLDDNEKVAEMLGLKRIGTVADCEKYADKARFVIGIGNNKTRKEIFEKYDLEYVTLIHPSAIISKTVKVGEGTVVLAGAIINADAKIGKQSIINTGAVVEHDCVIGEFTMVAPRATVCGFTKVGNSCWLGAGSVVNNVIKICDDVVVGSGAAVVKNIEEAGTYIGVPARRSK